MEHDKHEPKAEHAKEAHHEHPHVEEKKEDAPHAPHDDAPKPENNGGASNFLPNLGVPVPEIPIPVPDIGVGLHSFGLGENPEKPLGKYDLGEPFLGMFNPVVICGWGVSASQAAADAAAEAAAKAKNSVIPPGGSTKATTKL